MGAEQDKERRSRFLEGLQKHQKEQESKQWEGTFSEFLDLVAENPSVSCTAHEYLRDSILHFGVEKLPNGTKRYGLFENGPYALYGIEETLEEVVDMIIKGTENEKARELIGLLDGPPGSGKSTIADAIKWAMEQYSQTQEGARYVISTCPRFDDPLWLVPETLRPQFQQEFGIRIDGRVCPDCQLKYGDKPDWTEEKGLVKRIFISEKDRICIGTFWATDPKTQDISELLGTVDLTGYAAHGVTTHPDAYSFDGELNRSNRGFMEFGEMFRADEVFLRPLLNISEQELKVPNFANLHYDAFILGHTNIESYKKRLVNDKEAEALRRRLRVIDVPLNKKVSAEIRIYEKLIKEKGQITSRVHINPLTLRIAAIWTVLTRLKPSQLLTDPLNKMKFYDDQPISLAESNRPPTMDEIKKEAGRDECMSGIPPTYTVISLVDAMIKDDRHCLNPYDALTALKNNLDHNTDTKEMPAKEREHVLNMIAYAEREYNATIKREVQAAFVYSFEESAQALFDKYMQHVEAYIQKRNLTDPLTGRDLSPDEKFMRSLEERIGIVENAKKEKRLTFLAERGMVTIDRDRYTSYPRLREAIEAKLFADMRDYIQVATSVTTPNEEQLKRINTVAATLIEEHGFCSECANHAIRYVGDLLSKENSK